MTIEYRAEPTTVPIDGGQSVRIEAGQPWPSAYRGSRYSLVSDDDFEGGVMKWEQRDLQIFAPPPERLRAAMVRLGKSGGYGIYRVTANGELLTKIKAEDYKHAEQAPVNNGWVPVYVGTLAGEFSFDEVTMNPRTPKSSLAIWPGFPFHHGERWSVTQNGELRWRWKDYDFGSLFDHTELVDTYRSYRPSGGRIYITEHGHVWGNVSIDDVPEAKRQEVQRAVSSWKQEAEAAGDVTSLRLVNRRMVATSRSGDPTTGLLPVHFGHLKQWDDGAIPTVVVDDETYFGVVGQYEQVWE